MSERADLTGIVLAGGKSRRLGTDKASLTFEGRLLLETVIERLSGVCSEVIVASGRSAEGRKTLRSVRFVADLAPGRGPLAGVQAGLTAATAEFALVVACDMPFLNPHLLSYMAGLPRRYQALVPRIAGRWHPAHAIYARSCLPVIEELLAKRSSSMRELLSRLDVRELPEEELRRYDTQGLSLFNVNEPRDLERARALSDRSATGPESAP
ncbi:MAG: molybdenum cofactor guanylyltransferase [Chloroflexi bacterium]|nr:molybdenum cofactor guanylyltransferase [Chloroflexota bacterium]